MLEGQTVAVYRVTCLYIKVKGYLKASDTGTLSILFEFGIGPLNDLLVLDWLGGAGELLKHRESVGSHQLPNNSCVGGGQRGREREREREKERERERERERGGGRERERGERTMSTIEPHYTKDHAGWIVSSSIVPISLYVQKKIITQGKGLVAIMQILSIDSNHGEFEFVGQLNSIVAVLKLLHVSSHLLEGLLLVHLVPVHNAWLHLVKQLQKKNWCSMKHTSCN